MKVPTILTTCAAVALLLPVAHATAATKIVEYPTTQATSTPTRADVIRGEALNRRYHLGAYRNEGTRPTPAELRAMIIRGEALNRRYGLGDHASTGVFFSDVANSDAVARFQANAKADQSRDVVSRYATNLADDESATPSFSSDQANSNVVARHQALGRLHTPVSSGDDSVFKSVPIDAGIAVGLLLISLAGFTLARSRNLPGRPA